MAEQVVTLSFPAKADYLLLARLALSGLAREVPLDDELLADLKLAVTEACGNAVRHAYADGEGDVNVVFAFDDERLVVTVADRGGGIAVPDSVEDDAEALAGPLESGMGMPIIRAIVDELAVEEGDGGAGTLVRMVKYLPAG
ncbi:MAG TPA: ATP-binding protein [Gaiellaceae bacterium]|nr:ATP-binding protein [Gaiellaceae bacterium]